MYLNINTIGSAVSAGSLVVPRNFKSRIGGRVFSYQTPPAVDTASSPGTRRQTPSPLLGLSWKPSSIEKDYSFIAIKASCTFSITGVAAVGWGCKYCPDTFSLPWINAFSFCPICLSFPPAIPGQPLATYECGPAHSFSLLFSSVAWNCLTLCKSWL